MNYKEWAKKEEEELKKKQSINDLLKRGLDEDEFFSLENLLMDQPDDQPVQVKRKVPTRKRPVARPKPVNASSKENKAPVKKKTRVVAKQPTTQPAPRMTRSGRLQKMPSRFNN